MGALGVPEVFLGVRMQDRSGGGDEVRFVEEGGGLVVIAWGRRGRGRGRGRGGGRVGFDDGAGDDANVVLAREGLVAGQIGLVVGALLGRDGRGKG